MEVIRLHDLACFTSKAYAQSTLRDYNGIVVVGGNQWGGRRGERDQCNGYSKALGTYNLTTSYIVCLCLDIFVVDETIRCYCCTRYSAAVDNISVHSYRMMGKWYTCLPTYAEGAIDILSNLQGDGQIKYLSILGHVISNIRTAPNRLV